MQPSAPGVDAPSRAMAHKLFFALWPDDGVRAQVEQRAAALSEHFRPRGRLSTPDHYHMTLQFLGEEAALPCAAAETAAAAAVRVRASGFDLVLDQAGSFNETWWLGCWDPPAALLALCRALGDQLMRADVHVRPAQHFIPHVTVLRRGGARLATTPVVPVHWRVRDFALIRSQPPGPHVVLQRWPLADAE